MATGSSYDTTVTQPGYPAEPKSKASGCLKGCLIVAVVLVVIGAIIAFVVMRNWRSWTANAMSQGLSQMIDQSSMPAEEKGEVKAEVDRAIQAFRNGTMSMEQLGRMMQELMDSPLMPILIASSAESHLDQSGLSADEKTAGHLTIRRFNRGVFDKKISSDEFNSVLQHIGTKDQNGQWQPKQQPSDADLKAFLDKAKAAADTAQIPDDPEPIDISAEVKRIIDSAIGPQ